MSELVLFGGASSRGAMGVPHGGTGVGDGIKVSVGVTNGVWVAVAFGVSDGVWLAVGVTVGVKEGVLLAVGVTNNVNVGVDEGVLLAVGVMVVVSVGVLLAVGVTVTVSLAVGVSVGVNVGVFVGVLVTLGVVVEVGVGVASGSSSTAKFSMRSSPTCVNEPPTYSVPGLYAIAQTSAHHDPLTPPCSSAHVVPFHLARRPAVTPPAVVKSPPA